MSTSSTRDSAIANPAQIRDVRAQAALIPCSSECVDARAAVRLVCVVDAIERLQLVRRRNDRLPAERLAQQLADEVRALHEIRAGETPWDELADALAASATDPLGDKLAHVVGRLRRQISELLGAPVGTDDDLATQELATAELPTDGPSD